ncbi:hypothetical protein MHLP_04365 [Candidatus Mycoplasma haematolamae str. Purdue]|uniref:Uncharacterized protein n=1 Tax=Mycoplasma haematolamae (strain Purdue) TaxID=1212765 RepID=I7BKP0_MYCHA|nr:hypothetical protein [Candidatus Mycoplasma haematolamae]AFO52453.1 hypothetical protein MHLP_04365 [Candidatus Mycoplasma haematolamae str. Purdue]
MALSFPGIVAAAATLGAGITTNVLVVSAYQAGGGTLDLSNVPDDIKTGNFDWSNETKRQQREIFLKWRASVIFYLTYCTDEQKIREDKKEDCQSHKTTYHSAPEVKSRIYDTEKLRQYWEAKKEEHQ